jgi:hypothetical protein
MVNVHNIVVEWVALCFLEAPASHVDLDIGYLLREGIRGFLQSVQVNVRNVPQSRTRAPLLFPVRYLLYHLTRTDKVNLLRLPWLLLQRS